MSEWWTYGLSSFLLFSPRTYYRLFELYNAAIWPLQIVAVGLGAAILLLLRRGGPTRSRAIAAILATCWLWVAVAFLWHRYAKINFAATRFAWAFGLVAALLIIEGVVLGRLRFEWPNDFASKAGLWIFLFALVVEPLSAPLLGRGWKGIEVFGIAPDPTAVGTLGILLMAKGARRWPWMIIPAIWCAMTGATLLAMKAPDAWVAPAAAVLAVSLSISRTLAHRRAVGD